MAGIDDITPQVTIEGGDEAASVLQNIGAVGAEAFSKIFEAASAGDFTGLAGVVGGPLAEAFTKASESVLEFVHSEAEAIETQENLAASLGTTLTGFQGLQEAAASVGISTQGFDLSMGQLAQRVSAAWASIQQSVRTAADEQTSAQLQMEQAALGVQKAYNELEKTMQSVADQAVNDQDRIASAQTGLQRAILAQQKDQGFDTSGAEKVLKAQEDVNNVTKARHELEQANEKAAQDEADAVLKVKEAQEAVKEAQLKQSEAAEKAHEVDLKDIPAIADQINQVANGYKNWDQVANRAEISAQNLARAVMLAASPGTGQQPTGSQVFDKMLELFPKMGDSVDAVNAKMEILKDTLGTGFRPGQASAAQWMAILDQGKDAVKQFQDQIDSMKGGLGITDADVSAVKAFNAAWAELSAIIQQVAGHIAALAMPTLTKGIDAVKEGILTASNAIKAFSDGLDAAFGKGTGEKVQAVAAAVILFGSALAAVGGAFAALRFVITIMSAIATSVGAVIAKMEFWVVTIGLVAKAFAEVLQVIAVLSNSPGLAKFGETLEKAANAALRIATAGISDKLGISNQTAGGKPDEGAGADALGASAKQAAPAIDSAAQAAADMTAALKDATEALSNLAKGATPTPGGAATGGLIRGPGNGRDDRAGLWALSDGEYVMKSDAVQHYGVDLFHALNSLMVGGFATGGSVGRVSAPSLPTHQQASSVLNLTIDGEHFNGLRAPNDVAQKLKMHAVSRQSTATGRNPSWMR